MKLFTIAAILIITAFPLFGQSTEPNQDSPHFSTSVSYAKILTGVTSSQTSDVTIFTGELPVSPRWSIGYKMLQFGADGRTHLVGAKFSEKLGHIFKSKSLMIDLNKVQLSVEGGAGIKQDAGTTTFTFSGGGNTPAFGIGSCVAVEAGTLFSGSLKMGACLGGLFMPWNHVGPNKIALGSALNVSPLLQWSR